jgi:hypothetical protein
VAPELNLLRSTVPAAHYGRRRALDAEVAGPIDWHACGACLRSVDVADWLGLLDRYGEQGVSIMVQSVWLPGGHGE